MHSINAGVNAWREYDMLPADSKWDDYFARQARYYLAMHYYHNTVWRDVNHYAQARKASFSLYRHIRGIYNPVQRLCDGIVAYTYGGALDRRLVGGSIPIDTDNAELRELIAKVLTWSAFGSAKSLYARNMAQSGDTFLKVVDHRTNAGEDRVTIEVVDPRKVKHVTLDRSYMVSECVIEYEVQSESDTSYTYTEHITPAVWRTYHDNELKSEYANPLGFVPVVMATYKETDFTFGMNAFHNQTAKIDDANDLASLINASVRNTVQPLYLAKGVAGGSLSTNQNDPTTRDQVRLLYAASPTAELSALVNPIDIEGALTALDKQLGEIEHDLPVLGLQRLRDSNEAKTAPGVKAVFSDAIKLLEEVQANADTGLQRALNMALILGEIKGMWRTDVTAPDDNLFSIKPRPIINDSMTRLERVNTLTTLDPESPTAPLILAELGYDQDALATVQQGAQQVRANRIEQTLAAQTDVSRLIAQGRTSLTPPDEMEAPADGI